MTSTQLRLHRFALSGHCHRVELLLSLLRLEHARVDVDLVGGEHKRAPFLALNPLGQVPVLEDGELALADSNAILVYLAIRYDPDRTWLPHDPTMQARIQQWLSIAAGSLAFGPATARLIHVFGAPHDHARATAIAAPLFAFMEARLAADDFLVGSAPTLADVAMYAYTAHAPEGGISLAPYPALRSWLSRVEALPNFVPMQQCERRVAV